jgi:hypothetical protein
MLLVAIDLFRSLAVQGPEKITWKKHLASSAHRSDSMHRSAPWEALPEVWERLPLSCMTSTTGPLGGDAGDSGAPTIQRVNVNDRLKVA